MFLSLPLHSEHTEARRERERERKRKGSKAHTERQAERERETENETEEQKQAESKGKQDIQAAIPQISKFLENGAKSLIKVGKLLERDTKSKLWISTPL